MSNYDPNYVNKKVYVLVGQKAVVFNKQKQILILQRSKKSGGGGKWSLPGGALEFNEDLIEGIKREIDEETKLKVSNVTPFSIRSYLEENGDFVLNIGYSCVAKSDEVELNWEHTDYKWATKEEALRLDLTDAGKFFVTNL